MPVSGAVDAVQRSLTQRAIDAVSIARTLDAASAAGMLDLLNAGRTITVAALARESGCDLRMTAHVVNALIGIGMLSMEPRGVVVATPLAPALALQYRVWDGLSTSLQTGLPAFDVSRPEDAEALYGPGVAALEEMGRPQHEQFARLLGGSGGRVLDLGAGTAPWSRALATLDPDVTITAVDLPGVAPAAREAFEADGLGSRSCVVAADLTDEALPPDVGTGFDLVILAQVCRLFAPPVAEGIVRRAASRVRAGGTLAIVEALPDEDRADGATVALYELGLAMRTAEGGIHAFSDYQRWLRIAGMTDVTWCSLGMPEVSLIRALRPPPHLSAW